MSRPRNEAFRESVIIAHVRRLEVEAGLGTEAAHSKIDSPSPLGAEFSFVNKDAVLAQIRAERLIALIDADVGDDLVHYAEALSKGGINTLELTLTTPVAIATLKSASGKLPEFCFGLGTIVDVDAAQRGILAGASFIVIPKIQPAVITLCRRYHVPVIVSAFTCEEIAAAHAAGADAVKVFPSEHVGPAYIESIASKFPSLVLLPIGGITARSLPEFLRAGATAAFAGSSLIDGDTCRAKDWSAITGKARMFTRSLPPGLAV